MRALLSAPCTDARLYTSRIEIGTRTSAASTRVVELTSDLGLFCSHMTKTCFLLTSLGQRKRLAIWLLSHADLDIGHYNDILVFL